MVNMDDAINITHKHFDVLAPKAIRNLGSTDTFSDVTLVASDGRSLKAHKAIMLSETFQRILVSVLHSNPLIFCHNIRYDTLKRIKDFIYLGEILIPNDDLGEFLRTGVDLGIHGLVEIEAEDIPGGDSHENEIAKSVKEIISAEAKLGKNEITVNREGYFCCSGCEYSSKWKSHLKTIHDQVKYACGSCEYKVTNPGSLHNHVKSIHEQVKYACESCEYKATRPDSLRQHIKSIHDQVK